MHMQCGIGCKNDRFQSCARMPACTCARVQDNFPVYSYVKSAGGGFNFAGTSEDDAFLDRFANTSAALGSGLFEFWGERRGCCACTGMEHSPLSGWRRLELAAALPPRHAPAHRRASPPGFHHATCAFRS